MCEFVFRFAVTEECDGSVARRIGRRESHLLADRVHSRSAVTCLSNRIPHLIYLWSAPSRVRVASSGDECGDALLVERTRD